MEWLLVLIINFGDGGYDVRHTPVPDKAACEALFRATVGVLARVASAPFVYGATCINLGTGKAEAVTPPAREEEKPAPEPHRGGRS